MKTKIELKKTTADLRKMATDLGKTTADLSRTTVDLNQTVDNLTIKFNCIHQIENLTKIQILKSFFAIDLVTEKELAKMKIITHDLSTELKGKSIVDLNI